MGLISSIFRRWRSSVFIDEEEEESGEEYREYVGIVQERKNVNIHDRAQRETYVRGCLDQISYAAKEIDALNSF